MKSYIGLCLFYAAICCSRRSILFGCLSKLRVKI